MFLKRKKAQSTVEYIIVLTAIVGGIIAGMNIFANRAQRGTATGAGQVFDKALTKIEVGATGEIAKIVP